ncbi:MAG: hypothetical protein NTY77_13630 [Elusimicrobia bacterium]|nr:hypothetical protein [Elusimicrobiota bacterium]
MSLRPDPGGGRSGGEAAACWLAWSAQAPSAVRARAGVPAGWVYLGRSWRQLRRWESALGPGWNRIDIAPALHRCAGAARAPFLSYLEALARRHGAWPEWWLTRISDENTLSGSLFSDLCWLLTSCELLRGERPQLIVAESEALLQCLGTLDGSCRRLRTLGEVPVRMWRRARQAARWLLFFARFFRRVVAARVTRNGPILPARDGRPLALLHSCINSEYFSSPEGRDAYFGILPDELERRGIQVVTLPWLYSPGRSPRQAFAWFRSKPGRYLLAEDHYRLSDCVTAVRAVLRSAAWPESPQRVSGIAGFPEGLDITAMVEEQRRLQLSNVGAAEFALYPLLFERLAQAGWKPDVFIDTFENTLTEKPAVLALRRLSPATRTVGFQHWAAPPPLMLQHVAVPKPDISPLSDVIVCNSPFMRRLFIREGFPPQRLRVGPSLRYPHLLQEVPRRRPETGCIFVGFSLEIEGAVELLDSLMEAFPSAEGLTFWLKPHPQMTSRLWKGIVGPRPLPSHMAVVSGPITPWVERAACAVVGASTVSMDFAMAGVPLVIVGRAVVLDFSPLSHFPGWPQPLRGARELRREVLRTARLDEVERRRLSDAGRRLREECLSPVNDETISAFVEAAAKSAPI